MNSIMMTPNMLLLISTAFVNFLCILADELSVQTPPLGPDHANIGFNNTAQNSSQSTAVPSSLTSQIPKIDLDRTPTNLQEASELINALKEDLDKKITKCSFYEILFALRLLVEELEEAVYPIRALSRVPNRFYRWLILLLACQSNPKVQQLLELMKEREVDVPDFSEQLKLFYPDDSEALRSVRFPTSCFKDHTKVDNILEKEGKELTQLERKTISILINARYPKENKNSSEKYVSDKDPEEYLDLRYGCVDIAGRFDFPNLEDAEKAIRHFFKETKFRIVVNQVHEIKTEWGEGNLKYRVNFISVKDAIESMHDHLYSVQGAKEPITMYLLHCDTGKIGYHTYVSAPLTA